METAGIFSPSDLGVAHGKSKIASGFNGSSSIICLPPWVNVELRFTYVLRPAWNIFITGK